MNGRVSLIPMVLAALLYTISGSLVAADGATDCTKGCDIEMVRQATLKDNSLGGSLLPTMPASFSQDQSGRYLVVTESADRILTFDSSGVSQTVVNGRPREPFRLITNILGGSDGSVHIYDLIRKTLVLLDRNLEVRRAFPFLYRPTLLLDDGTYIHADHIPSPDLVGQPIHHLDSEGRVLRSFGADETRYRADESRRYSRVVSVSSGTTSIWSAAPGIYSFERWDYKTGTRLAKVSVASAWFTESAKAPRYNERPTPAISAHWEVDGYMWVLLSDADTEWSQAAVIPLEQPFDLSAINRAYDWVLEVIEIGSGRVVASRRFDRILAAYSPTFLLVTPTEPASGSSELNVWKPRIIPKEKNHGREY